MKTKKRGAILKIVLVFSIVLFCYLFYDAYSELNYNRKEKEELNTLKTQKISEGEELDRIREEHDSNEYAEEYARSIGYVKSNEKIFRNYNDKK